MMATHAEMSGKNLEFWIQKSVQTLKREIELQMSLFNLKRLSRILCRMLYCLIKYRLSLKMI